MAAVSALGEVGLIEKVLAPALRAAARGFNRAGWKLALGIGDDAAVLRGGQGKDLLFASDMVVEGVHFTLRDVPAPWIGWKALARNVSDIAAMGGLPVAAVVSLGLPRSARVATVRGIYQGLSRCAKRFNLALAGGDTVRAPKIVIDVAILGEVARGKAVLRSGVRPGDTLFVTGRLGGSRRGARHARFIPRVGEAQALLRRARIHGMIDLSDGLASGLRHLAAASRARLRLNAAAVPRARGVATLREALSDGEDFELLFSVPAQDRDRVPAKIGRVPVTAIGRVLRGAPGVEVEGADGRIRPLREAGFQHFQK